MSEFGEVPADVIQQASRVPTAPALEVNPAPEVQPQRNFAIFFAGGLGKDRDILGLRHSFQDLYGKDNVRMFNSMLSTDRPNPQRFEQMADEIVTQVEQGANLSLIAHSLGSSELTRALQIIDKRNPGFLTNPENLKRLNITLIAPSGLFEGASGGLRFIKGVAQFATSGMELGRTRSYNYLPGIDSTTFIPPKTVGGDELIHAVRESFPELSLMRENLTAVNFTPIRDYADRLSDTDRQQLSAIDDQLKEAVEKQDRSAIREILRRRGKLLAPHIGKAYVDQGEPEQSEPVQEEKLQPRQMLKLYGGALLGLRSLLADTFRGEPLQMMNALRQRGVKIRFVVPEYDRVVPLENIVKFFNLPTEDLNTEVTILSLFSHASFAYQPEALTRALAPTIRQEVEEMIKPLQA